MITEEGYKLETSDRIIPHTGIDLSLLTPEEFKELKETHVTMISQMQVKSNIHKIDEKIDSLIIKIDKAIKISSEIQKINQSHAIACPINKNNIVSIVENWYAQVTDDYMDSETVRSRRLREKIVNDVKDFIKESILTTGNIAGAIIAMLSLLGFIGLVVYLATKLAE